MNNSAFAAIFALLFCISAASAEIVESWDFTDGTNTISSLQTDGWVFGDVGQISISSGGLSLDDQSNSAGPPSALFDFGGLADFSNGGMVTLTGFASGSTNIRADMFVRDSSNSIIAGLLYHRANTIADTSDTRITWDTPGANQSAYTGGSGDDTFNPGTNASTLGTFVLQWDAANDYTMSFTSGSTLIYSESGTLSASPDQWYSEVSWFTGTGKTFNINSLTIENVSAIPEPCSTMLLLTTSLICIRRKKR